VLPVPPPPGAPTGVHPTAPGSTPRGCVA